MELLQLTVGILIGVILCTLLPKIPIGLNDLIKEYQQRRKKNGTESSNQAE